MPNLLTLEDFKDKELDPNSTPLEVLAFVAEVALQKVEESKQTIETNSSTEEKVQPLKNNKRKSSHKQFTTKKKREDSAASVLPEEFKRRIIKKSGGTWPDQIICIYKNTLSNSDVEKHFSRLAMPLKKMEDVEFLKDKEKALLNQGGAIQVPLTFEGKNSPSEIKLNFKHWNASKQYVLNGGWNEIVKEDKLKKGQTIHVWAFRDTEKKLCMALVKHG
ncbi:hypothetical protein K1719_021797 [Acacia pycnantha]|nr:hypothetical protein K1719_021797 [Acacia pycnantha]